MQPLISPVDHESRHGSYRTEDVSPTVSEESPLLVRFPRGNDNTNVVTIVVVGLMVVVLLSGFAIGVYLLVLQNNSENILPPVKTPFKYMARSQWDNNGYQSPVGPKTFQAQCLVVEQTQTRECLEEQSCLLLLNEIKGRTDYQATVPFNFLISSNGDVYEYLGWGSSPLYQGMPALVVGFIGNFTNVTPTHEQIESAKNLVWISVTRDYLDRNFTIISNNDTEIILRYINNIFVESIPIK